MDNTHIYTNEQLNFLERQFPINYLPKGNERQVEVTNVLVKTKEVNNLKNQSAIEAEKALCQIPMLPMIDVFSIQEYETLMFSMLTPFTPEVLSLCFRVSPLDVDIKNDEAREFEFKHNNSQGGFKVIFEIKQYNEKFVVEVGVTVGMKVSKTLKVTLDRHEIIVCEYIFNQHIKRTEFLTGERIYSSDVPAKITQKRYEVDYTEEFYVKHLHSELGAEYKAANVITQNITLAEIKCKQKELLDFSSLRCIKRPGDIEVYVNALIPTHVIDIGNVNGPDIAKLYHNKRNASALADSFACQAAGYQIEMSNVLQAIEPLISNDLDRVLVDMTQSLISITELLAKVSTWEDFKIKFDDTSIQHLPLGDDLISYEFATQMQDVSMVSGERKGVLLNEGGKKITVDYGAIDYLVHKDKELIDILVIKNQNFVAYVQVEVTVRSKKMPQLRKTHISNNNDGSNENMFIVNVSNVDQDEALQSSATEIAVNTVKKYRVYSTVQESIRVQFKSIVFCEFKGMYVPSTIVEDDLGVTFTLFNKSSKIKLIDGKPIEYVSREYGTLYGVQYILRDAFDITINTEMCVQVDNAAEITIYDKLVHYFTAAGVIYDEDISQVRGGSMIQDGILSQFSFTYDAKYAKLIMKSESNVKFIQENLLMCDEDYINSSGISHKYYEQGQLTKRRAVYAIQTLLCELSGELSFKRQIPPDSIGAKMYLNQYQTVQEKINTQLKGDIDRINIRLETVENKVNVLEQELRQIVSELHPPFYKMLMAEIASGLVGILVPIALNQFVKHLSNLVGSLRRVFNVAFSLSTHMRHPLSSQDYEFPYAQISSSLVFMYSVFRALGKESLIKQIHKWKRPLFSTSLNDVLQFKYAKLDMVEKYDTVVSYMRSGIARKVNNKVILMRPEKNVSTYHPSLPVFDVFYRPLDVIPAPLNRILHARTLTSNIRDELIRDAQQANTRRVSHSFAVWSDFNIDQQGVVTMERVYMGIGELNKYGIQGSDLNSGIGGVHIKYTSQAVDEQGVRIFQPMAFDQCGYNISDVNRLFATLFKPKGDDVFSSMDVQDKWNNLTIEIDRRILSGSKLYSSYVPDASIGAAFKALLNNPPPFHYKLFHNNCQNFTSDLISYHKNGYLPDNWPEITNTLMTKARLNFIHEAVIDLESTHRKRRDINEIYDNVLNVRTIDCAKEHTYTFIHEMDFIKNVRVNNATTLVCLYRTHINLLSCDVFDRMDMLSKYVSLLSDFDARMLRNESHASVAVFRPL